MSRLTLGGLPEKSKLRIRGCLYPLTAREQIVTGSIGHEACADTTTLNGTGSKIPNGTAGSLKSIENLE